ncbi:MAG: ABC transporter ATP-binding protein [Microthrixaceae bacterium]
MGPPPAAPVPPPTAPDWAAQVLGAVKVYGQGPAAVVALDHVTVGFERGRFTAIMGPSGSGKSTLMQCAAGLDRLTAGQVLLGDTDLTRLNEKRLTLVRRATVGFIFQQFNLLPALTAEDNIRFPLRLGHRPVDQAWFDQVVDTVGLRDRLGHRPAQLSGGQQQRVAVARALVERPDLLFADEPTGNLDSTSSTEILRFLRGAVDSWGQTVVMVTHDPVAAAWADRVLFLADGRIVDDMVGPTRDAIIGRMGRMAA